MRRPASLLLAAAVLLPAGCGGDDQGAAPRLKEPGPAPDTPELGERSRPSPEDAPGGAGDEEASPERGAAPTKRQTARACKETIDRGQVSDELRIELERVCEEAARGDRKALTEATRRACRKLVEEADIPDGNTRRNALAACDRQTAAPLGDR